MLLRGFRLSDVLSISLVWERYFRGLFGLPSRDNVVADAVVELDERVIAYGTIKNYYEVIMVLDHSLPIRDKVNAVKMLMQKAEYEAKLAGIEQLQLFVQDDSFKNILEKHFGFTVCGGTAMVKTINLGDS
jgi:hypothetical protein